MEISEQYQVKDLDSMKLLYKYQYAFLNMQKHYTCLIKIIRIIIQKSLLKSLKHWKFLSSPSNFLMIHLSTFAFTLKSLEFKFNLMIKSRRSNHFFSILSFSALKDHYNIFLLNYKNEKEKSQKELKTMDLEVKTLKMNQAELEIITNYYAKNEGGKQKKGTVRTLTEKLITENYELEKQIEDMDRKTVELFEELNLALDSYEQSKKGKGKRGKKKIVASSRKSFMPISY